MHRAEDVVLILESDGQVVGMAPDQNFFTSQKCNNTQSLSLIELAVPEDRTRLLQHLANPAKFKIPPFIPYRFNTAYENRVPCTIQIRKMSGNGRFSEYLQCRVMRDVTNDDQAAPSNSFSIISKLFQRSPILCTLALVETGQFTFVNDAFLEKTGYSQEQVLGRTPEELGLLDKIDAQIIHREIKNKSALTSKEIAIRTVDGRQLVCLFFCKLSKLDGSQQILTLAQDITEEYLARSILRRQAANLEIIFNSVPNILALVNEEGRVERINKQAEKFTGKRNADILGLLGGEVLNCLNSYHGAGCGRNVECNDCQVRMCVMKTLQTGAALEEKSGTMTFLVNGQAIARNLLISTVPLHTEGAAKVLLSIRDVTEYLQVQREREHLQSHLNQMQKMESIGRVTSGVAHDLNNLLVPILGYAQILYQDLPSDDPSKDPAKQIYRAGLKASELLNQLLVFSRKQDLQFAPVNLSDVVMDFELFLRRTLFEDIQLIFNCPDSLPTIKADKGQIEQILMNLAMNAQDAMDGGGVLQISTSCLEITETDREFITDLTPGPWVMLLVKDNGCGMEPDVLEKIYEPFFTTKPQGKGTGLGLSTVYGITEQHEGILNVASTPGQGTEFRIFFPVLNEKSQSAKSEEIEQSPPGQGRILVVEDELRLRELLSTVLKRAGYQLMIAENGVEALEILQSETVDLLLTDVVMPEISGVELYNRAHHTNPAMKVLYMSGYSAEIIADRGVLNDAPLLDKPFSINKLLRTIRTVL